MNDQIPIGSWPTQVIEVIETWDRRGTGTKSDPIRMVRQYWSLKGKLLWEEETPYDRSPFVRVDFCQRGNLAPDPPKSPVEVP